VNLILMDMSSGTRSSRSGSSSKMEDVISVTITAAEVESIVHKAVSQAVTDIKELFNSKLEALESRVQILEDRLSELENSSVSNGSEQSQVQMTTELTTELQAMRSETRESLLSSNDNEQYSRRNNVRILGFKPNEREGCRSAAVRFIKNVLKVSSVCNDDIEVAHMAAGLSESTANQQRRLSMVVRFCRRDKRDQVIRSRRILKGTHYAVTEDLTTLNVKTMNRLRNSDEVRATWSWNGKIYAIMSNGNKVLVRPFQPISELLAS